MANEARINSSLQINKGNLKYQSQPTAFLATVTGTKGPVPGALAITTSGVNISFTELTTPALCRIMNLDATNYVEWGIYDGTYWFPLGEILPGESYVFRLSRNLGQEDPGTGSGNRLRIQANTATCQVVVEAFEA